jgi:hypothetical protein
MPKVVSIASKIEERDIFDVLDDRRFYTPDWKDLKEYNHVFLPTILGTRMRNTGMIGTNIITPTSKIFNLGTGITSFDDYLLLKDYNYQDYVMIRDKNKSKQKSKVQGNLFSLTKMQLHLLDTLYYDMYGLFRTKIAVKMMDQRVRHDMSKRPIGLFWTWVGDAEDIEGSSKMPLALHELNNDLGQLVYSS